MENVEEKQVKVGVFACTSCGADLKYKPGSQKLKCDFCGAENEIPTISQPIEELDFQSYLANQSSKVDSVKETYVKCESCGASSTLLPNVSSSLCPYCSTPLVVANAQSESIIQPKLLIPFKLTIHEAQAEFKKWVAKLWFAPDDLKKASLSLDQFKGIYIPYWTFDTVTQSSYIGQRGENYYVTESYTVTENGQTVSKTREVQKTRWFPASGIVNRNFDDILVPATKSLPQDKLSQLEPWDLVNLVPYDINFLSGFVTEKYQIDLAEGFEIAKGDRKSVV
jgi:LSD1 subclass zinc finger protein